MSQSAQGPIPGEVTQLLAAVRQGDGSAMDRLMTLVYDELRAVARRQLRRWHPGQTLDTTALVHETYLRLVDQAGASWRDRVHFLSVAGVAMRHILVDAARRRVAKKRGGEGLRLAQREATAMRDALAAVRAVARKRSLRRFDVDDAVLVLVSLTFSPLSQQSTFMAALGKRAWRRSAQQ